MQKGGASSARIRARKARAPRKRRSGSLESLLLRWRPLFRDLYDAVIVTDLEGRIVEWNPAASSLYGCARGEALAKSAEFLNPPSEGRAISRTILHGLEKRGIWVGEIRVVRRDGSEGVCESVVVPVRDERGGRIAVISFDRDITARKTEDMALRASERSLGIFRELIDRCGENLSIIDLETGRFLYVNEMTCTSTGYSRGELLRMRVIDIDPSATEPWSVERERAARTGSPVRAREGLVRRKDGSVFPVEVSSSLARIGDREYMIATARDVSERRLAGTELARQRDFLRQVIDVIPDLVFVKDSGDRYLLANRGLADIYGKSPEEVTGKTDVELGCDPVEAERFREADREVLRTRGEMVCPEEAFSGASGETRYYQTTRKPLADENGDLTRLLAVSVDITERLRMWNQLVHAQKMETVGRLAGGVAHDFNNLLAIILNCAYFIHKGLPPDSPLCEDASQILETTERCIDLIRKLLAFSRRQRMNLKAVGVAEILRGAEKMLRRLLPESISLEIGCAPDAGMVRADPAQMEHVLINLSLNARDAMRDGGSLSVRASRGRPPAAGRDAGEGERDWVLISVADTGEGMSEEVQSHLFEPYFTTKEMGKGTGLGLSSIYGIVRQHGGEIEVRSAPGEGSEFRIFLPQLGEGADLSPHGGNPAGPPRGFERVMLVEDQRVVRGITARMLRDLGYDVREAGSGEEALALAGSGGAEGVRLLITDVIMPGMGGRRLADALAREIPGLRVLYVSGYPEDVVGRSGVLEPGLRFLPKPFDPMTIGRMLREILEGPPPSPAAGREA